MPKRIRELSEGEIFGKLTILSKLEGTREATYLCECSCGTHKKATGSNLLRSKIKTCGQSSCRNKAITHGMSNTPLYSVWLGMRYRVNNPVGNNACYKDIKICEEWDTFETFYDWAINNGYKQGLSIDRIKGSEGYSPSNCRWTTDLVQSQNRKGWTKAEVPLKGVYKSKPRNGKVKYSNTGDKPYYWRYSYNGEKFQGWGFSSAEEAYEDKCKHIKSNFDGLVIP